MRPVINLKALNTFVTSPHFKMEGIHLIWDLMVQGDWLTRIDLNDAYFAVPIHNTHQKYLRFIWQQQTHQFTCLPFRLSSAPRVFTKLLKPVVAYLLIGTTSEAVLEHTGMTADLPEALGFLINYPKSQLTPQQSVQFLGFLQQNEAESTRHQGKAHNTRSQESDENKRRISKAASTVGRKAIGCNSSSTSSSTSLQKHPEAQAPSPYSGKLQQATEAITRIKAGPIMVDQQLSKMEWAQLGEIISECRNRNR